MYCVIYYYNTSVILYIKCGGEIMKLTKRLYKKYSTLKEGLECF